MTTYAIYAEFEHVDDSIFQFILVPGTRVGGRPLPAILYFRRLTEEHSRRTWQYVKSPSYMPPLARMLGTPDPGLVMNEGLEQLQGLSSAINSVTAVPDYALRGAFPVIVNDTDKLAILEKENKVPAGINDRIRILRGTHRLPNLPGR